MVGFPRDSRTQGSVGRLLRDLAIPPTLLARLTR